MTHHAVEGGAFDGALDPAPEPSEPTAPSRPATIELAAAILVVGGVISLVGALSALIGAVSGGDPFLGLTVALAVGSIVVGLLTRLGRAWIVAVNYVAVLGFLDLLASGASPLSLMLGLADILVLVILFARKPWFDAMRAHRAAQPLTPPTARPPTR